MNQDAEWETQAADARARMAAEQQVLRAQFGQLYDEALAILFKHDPIGLNAGVNDDEYDPEVRTILPRLPEAHSAEDLRRIMHEEFDRWFNWGSNAPGQPQIHFTDQDIAGPEHRYDAPARELWDAWQRLRP